MEITLLHQVSPYIRVKKQRNIKSWDQQNYLVIRPKKKKLLCCPLPTDRKMRKKTGSGFFLFYFFKCQIWAKNLLTFVFNGLKKHLYICVLTAFRPSFPHLETFKKILENSTLSRYVKKKKKNWPTDPIFKFWSGEGNITIFFFWPNRVLLYPTSL